MRVAILAICLTVVSCERVSLTPFALKPCHLDGLAKEAQTAPWMTFTPMMGQHVMLTSLVRGEAPALAHLASLSVITVAAGAAAWLAAARQLGRESVLRRTNG